MEPGAAPPEDAAVGGRLPVAGDAHTQALSLGQRRRVGVSGTPAVVVEGGPPPRSQLCPRRRRHDPVLYHAHPAWLRPRHGDANRPPGVGRHHRSGLECRMTGVDGEHGLGRAPVEDEHARPGGHEHVLGAVTVEVGRAHRPDHHAAARGHPVPVRKGVAPGPEHPHPPARGSVRGSDDDIALAGAGDIGQRGRAQGLAAQVPGPPKASRGVQGRHPVVIAGPPGLVDPVVARPEHDRLALVAAQGPDGGRGAHDLVGREAPQQAPVAPHGPDHAPSVVGAEDATRRGVPAHHDLGGAVSIQVGQGRRGEDGVVGVEGPPGVELTVGVPRPALQPEGADGHVGHTRPRDVTHRGAGVERQRPAQGVHPGPNPTHRSRWVDHEHATARAPAAVRPAAGHHHLVGAGPVHVGGRGRRVDGMAGGYRPPGQIRACNRVEPVHVAVECAHDDGGFAHVRLHGGRLPEGDPRVGALPRQHRLHGLSARGSRPPAGRGCLGGDGRRREHHGPLPRDPGGPHHDRRGHGRREQRDAGVPACVPAVVGGRIGHQGGQGTEPPTTLRRGCLARPPSSVSTAAG